MERTPQHVGSGRVAEAKGMPSRRAVVSGLLGGGALGVMAAPFAQAEETAAGRSRPWMSSDAMPVNVKDYGATGDGTTDDTVAVQAAITAADETTRSVFFPAGTYVVTAPVQASQPLTLFGEGMWRSIVALPTDVSFIDPSIGSSIVELEDLGFDRRGRLHFMFEIDGDSVRTLTVTRCRFFDFSGPHNTPACFHLRAFGDVEFVDCMWHNSAAHAGQGVAVRTDFAASGHRLTFRGNNRFLWMATGIKCDTGWLPAADRKDGHPPHSIDLVEVDGAYFDGYWWLLPAIKDGEGGSVSYTADGLTDSGADFSDLVESKVHMNVRAMPVRRTGQITSALATELVDDAADFAALGALRGEIVRSGNVHAVVVGVGAASTSVLQLEGWLDNETLLPADPPGTGADYTLFQVLIGQCKALSATELAPAEPNTKGGWKDLTGTYITPPAGTRYEVQTQNTNYHINSSVGVQNLRVTNSTFKRGWADQIGFFGRRAQVIGNRFEDGNDVGCTIQTTFGTLTKGHVVVGNTFRHQGSVGIFINGDDCVVAENRLTGNGWNIQLDRLADIQLNTSTDCVVTHNIGESSADTAREIDGIAMRGPCTGNVFDNNRKISESASDIQITGAGIENNRIIGARSVRHVGAAVGQILDMTAEGSPEGVVLAAPGSIYRRTDGGAGESLYMKESGTGATGWVAK